MKGLKSLRHPNIIRLRDSGIEDETAAFYLVLDWVDRSLSDVLRQSGPYDWDQFANSIAQPLASALSHAHLKSIEHRDIKPKNVLIAPDGSPLLADFGIAKIRSSLNPTDRTVGMYRSGPYAPPEADAPLPYIRDVYSMGVLLIQAMHEARITDFHEVAPALESISVPPDIRRLLQRCTSTDPTERPANGTVLAEELREAVDSNLGVRTARRNMAWLKLTASARRQLLAGATEATTPEAVAMADLNGEVFADFRFDRETAGIDRRTVFLVGAAWRLTLKPDESQDAFIVTAARSLDYDALEAIRRRSMNVGRLVTWTCTPPRERRAANAGLEALLRGLEDFNDSRIAASEYAQDRELQDDLFDDWGRLLQAREEIARGERRPLRYQGRQARGREVDFSLTNQTDLDLVGDEMEVVIEESRRTIARGEVINQADGEVTLRAARIFPALPARGTLVPYLGPTKIALQRQMDAVSAVKSGTSARDDLRDMIVDPTVVSAPTAKTITSWNRNLDDGKREAVSAALGAADLVLVQGPPGTGKTDFIAETVYQFLQMQPDGRVLIVSQTHVAVDNALARLEAAGVGGLVRLGKPDDPRVDGAVKHLLLDQRMSKWAAAIRRKAEGHLEREAAAVGIESAHLRAALALQQLISVLQEQTAVRAYIEASDETSESSDLATGLGVVDDAAGLQERMDRLLDQQAELFEEAQRQLAGDLTVRADMSANDARSAVDALIGSTGRGQTLLRLLDLQAQWLQRVSSDRNLATAFLNTARVVAGTCLGFLSHGAVRSLDIDLCILDEASKATATEALVPMARSRRWILVGDTSQLPPLDEELLRSPELLGEYGLEADFVRETLFQRMAHRLPTHSQFMLTDQYRMIRAIGDMISTCFYDGKLRSPNTRGLHGYDLLGKPVLWIDTAHLGDRRREDVSSDSDRSVANREEARIVLDRLRTLDQAVSRNLIAKPLGGRQLEVLLIAPYRRQVDELTRRTATASLLNLDVSVQSVDAVQGRECDIAIFSVTRSNPGGRLGFLGADYWRRINVALSRARSGLTIVGDADFCRSSPGALREVLDYISSHPEDCELRKADHA